jgi:predicted DNA-binding antitoxin AbrB/MazE fold protein
MKRIKVKLSEGTEAHLEVLIDDLLKDMKNKSVTEIKWIIREAFTEGIIHCAALHLEYESKKRCV